jgi:hypothetical protein
MIKEAGIRPEFGAKMEILKVFPDQSGNVVFLNPYGLGAVLHLITHHDYPFGQQQQSESAEFRL